MSDEQQLYTEVDRAERAKQILEHDLYKEAFTLIRTNLLADIENSKTGQSEIREEAWRKLHVLKELERYFRTIMQTGEMAKISLRERFKRFV